MKYWVLIGIVLCLQGCVYATYNSAEGMESLRVISLFKEIDGFAAERDDFSIIIDKTRSQDPFEGLADLIESWDELQSMGLRYEPPVEIPYRVEPDATN
jgi:hypothetical protein